MHEMVYAVRDEMVAAYPELKESAERVAKVVLAEEMQFARVLSTAMAILDRDIADLSESIISEAETSLGNTALRGEVRASVLAYETELVDAIQKSDGYVTQEKFIEIDGKRVFDGKRAFRLYETYGLPLDFIEDAVRDAGLAFDLDGFDRVLADGRNRFGCPAFVERSKCLD